MTDEHFLSRWSRRKTLAKTQPAEASAPVAAPLPPPPVPQPEAPVAVEPPLPPVESLTLESDFTPFMRPGVDEALKRRALKTLLADPRFNVMDGLDVYIDDYSKPDPLPEGWLEKLNAYARLDDWKPVPPAEEGVAADSADEPEQAPDLPTGEEEKP